MSFRLKNIKFENCVIPIWESDGEDEQKSENYYTILIGKNGTGKSRLLAEICRTFYALDNDIRNALISGRQLTLLRHIGFDNPFNIEFSIFGRNNKLYFDRRRTVYAEVDGISIEEIQSIDLPNRVIATTITPFDKFPIGQRRSKKEDRDVEYASIYRYLGAKNNAGQLSNTGQISRVIESLVYATQKERSKVARLSQVFELLGYLPRIAVDYRLKFSQQLFENLQHYLNQDKPSVEDLRRILNGYLPSRYLFESQVSKSAHFAEELCDALIAVTNAASNKQILTIELDFENITFVKGSLDVFRHIRFLRSYGLLHLDNLRLSKTSSQKDISFKDTSSGEQGLVLTFLGIASEIEDCSLVIVDEPEISLHPEWQENFIPLMKSTFSGYRGCHFLFATHSPLILTKAEGNCAVVTMDDLTILGAAEFSKRSADYQLAETFNTPGYRNEYLARESLAALRLASHRQFDSEEFQEKLELLRRARPRLDDDDPVAQLADALINAVEELPQ